MRGSSSSRKPAEPAARVYGPRADDPIRWIFRARHYPARGYWAVFQEHAARILPYLLSIYSLGLLYLMARQSGIFFFGIGGGLALFGLLQWMTIVRMRRQVVEVGVTYGGYWVRSLYDVARARPARVWPRRRAMPQRQGAQLRFQLEGNLITLDQSLWEDDLGALAYHLQRPD